MTRSLAPAALLTLCLLVAPPPRAGTAEEPRGAAGEGTTPYPLHLPGLEPENVVCVRVLAFEQGRARPLEGARVSGWSEEIAPTPVVRSRLLAEGFTDGHGFANVTWPEDGERPFHWLVQAKGKAVRVLDGGRSGTVVLAPGGPYRLRVWAPMGDPLVGARVEYYIYGCPHSPSAAEGTTDEHGEVVLEGLPLSLSPDTDEWGQLWIVGEGVQPGTYSVPQRRLDGTTPILLTRVGRTAHGVVQDEAGKPMAGVAVRELGYPRGPATTTDSEGRFRIFGLSGSGGFAFYVPGDLLGEGRPNAVVEHSDADVPIRLTLRRGRANVPGQGEASEVVEVEVKERTSTEAPPSQESGVPVRLTRLSDGLVVTGETGTPTYGLFSTLIPPGRYRVRVGGGFSTVVEGVQEVDLPSEEPVRFVLDAAPTLMVRTHGPRDGEWAAELRLPVGSESATDLGGHFLRLPPEGRALVRVDRVGPVLVPVGPPEDGWRVATLPAPDPAVVRVRARSADPEIPLDGFEALWADDRFEPFADEDEDEDEEIEENECRLTTHRRGRRLLTLQAHGFQDRTREVLVQPDDRAIDLGVVLLEPLRPTTLTVHHADGTPTSELEIRWGLEGQWGNELQEDDGTFALELGPEPTPCLLGGEGVYPLPLRVSSEGPFEVRLPAGALEVRVRGPEGEALQAAVYVDHVRVFGSEGVHVLRGIPPGRHDVIVGARGCMGILQQVEIGEGEKRVVEARLRSR